MKTLEEEIARLRGEDKKYIRIDADLPAGIPSSYIPQESVRITLFRRFLKEDDPKEFHALLEEIVDRFGPVPEELRALWGMTLIRNAGAHAGIDAFRVTKKESVLTGHSSTVFSLLRTKKRWIVLEDKAVGPGGASAIADVVEALCSNPTSGRIAAIGE
jgi:transcription-repair coupling factor (superfamily II helicase)